MLAQNHRDLLVQATTEVLLTPVSARNFLDAVRPGSWAQFVPVNASLRDAVAAIVDAANAQGWVRNIVVELAAAYPARPEFALILESKATTAQKEPPWKTYSKLPRRNRPLIGRDGLLEELAENLSDPTKSEIVQITGVHGVGKTALMVEIAQKLMIEQVFEDCVFISAKTFGATGPGESESDLFDQVLDEILSQTSWGREGARLPGEVRSGLASTLILLNELDTGKRRVTDKIIKNLESLGSSKILITNRKPITESRLVSRSLGGLEGNHGIEYLRAELKANAVLRASDLSDADLLVIVEHTGGLPLRMAKVVGEINASREEVQVREILSRVRRNGRPRRSKGPGIKLDWQRLNILFQKAILSTDDNAALERDLEDILEAMDTAYNAYLFNGLSAAPIEMWQCFVNAAMKIARYLGRVARLNERIRQGEQALKVAIALKDHNAEARLRGSVIGWAQLQIGEYPQAFDHCRQAYTFAVKAGERILAGETARTLSGIARDRCTADLDTRSVNEAITWARAAYQHAKAAQIRSDADSRAARILKLGAIFDLANAARLIGAYRRAKCRYRLCIATAEQGVVDDERLASRLCDLGQCLLCQGDTIEADRCFSRAYDICLRMANIDNSGSGTPQLSGSRIIRAELDFNLAALEQLRGNESHADLLRERGEYVFLDLGIKRPSRVDQILALAMKQTGKSWPPERWQI
jgi:tetratricopeptide (TPR) repeat protein